jgi:hypothetical protein
LLVAPEVLLDVGPIEGVVTTLQGTDATVVGLAAGLIAGVYLGVAARSRPDPDTVPAVTSADSRFDMAATRPPEEVTTNPQTLAASSLDAEIDAAIQTGGEPLQRVRSKLFRTATAVYADAAGLDAEQARTTVAGGQWTRDPAAIAFLAGPTGPRPPLRRRVWLWLTPGHERRVRIERTIDAIERLREQR